MGTSVCVRFSPSSLPFQTWFQAHELRVQLGPFLKQEGSQHSDTMAQ